MFSDLLKWGKRGGDAADIAPPKGADLVVASKAFPKFLTSLKTQPEPSIVLDFGPVIGGNVGFLGERLGCKLFIEDLISEFDRHKKSGSADGMSAVIDARLKQEDASIDGVLCWDFFDFLDRPAAQTLARQIARILRPGGAVMGFFCTSGVERAPFTKYEIIDDQSLRHRHHPGTGGRKLPLQNRDIIKMFEGLTVSDSFLLKNNTREILLRNK